MPSTEETPQRTTREDPGDEAFTPRGTALLLALYLALLVLLWCFMYFVEFIGRGPTIIAT